MNRANFDKTLVLIPARMASTRLPGKPLADIAGLPTIVQVARRAAAADVGRIVVAVGRRSAQLERSTARSPRPVSIEAAAIASAKA